MRRRAVTPRCGMRHESGRRASYTSALASLSKPCADACFSPLALWFRHSSGAAAVAGVPALIRASYCAMRRAHANWSMRRSGTLYSIRMRSKRACDSLHDPPTGRNGRHARERNGVDVAAAALHSEPTASHRHEASPQLPLQLQRLRQRPSTGIERPGWMLGVTRAELREAQARRQLRDRHPPRRQPHHHGHQQLRQPRREGGRRPPPPHHGHPPHQVLALSHASLLVASRRPVLSAVSRTHSSCCKAGAL